MSKIQSLWSQYTEWFVILSGDNSRSKKWSILFWNISIVKDKFLSNLLRGLYTWQTFSIYITNKVLSTKWLLKLDCTIGNK